MKNWEKAIVAAIALALLFTMTACGNKNEEKPAEEPEQ